MCSQMLAEQDPTKGVVSRAWSLYVNFIAKSASYRSSLMSYCEFCGIRMHVRNVHMNEHSISVRLTSWVGHSSNFEGRRLTGHGSGPDELCKLTGSPNC